MITHVTPLHLQFDPNDWDLWRPLISFRPEESIQIALHGRFGDNASIHWIEDAYPLGDVNLDFYPVLVTKMTPNYSAESLMGLIRRDINLLVADRARFTPYSSYHNQSATPDATTWKSKHPHGALITINIVADDGYGKVEKGSVVSTHLGQQDWIFSTLETPGDWRHPVSGNRMFSFTETDVGLLYFTLGADRATILPDYVGSKTGGFAMADRLWSTFQSRLLKLVEKNGGEAEIVPRISSRWPWPKVKRAVFKPTRPRLK